MNTLTEYISRVTDVDVDGAGGLNIYKVLYVCVCWLISRKMSFRAI